MRTSLSLYLLAGALLAGPAMAEPTHTVDWYRQHPVQRSTLLQQCRNDPGGIGRGAACENAEKADALNAASQGVIRRKPMTADEMKRTLDALESRGRL